MNILVTIAVAALLAFGVAFAQESTTETPSAQTRSSDFAFRVMSAVDSLVADGESETTLVALLSTGDGSPIEGERIRFILESGNAFLGGGTAVAVNAEEIDNGLYTTTLQAGTVEGPVEVSAVWVSSPDSPLPVETVGIDLVTASELVVEVDDPVVLADGRDDATVIAYLLDGLGRPVDNANVTFRLVDGSGRLIQRGGTASGKNGRYAATFRPDRTPGDVRIEVALPTNTRTLREEVHIEVVEATRMDAIAFPERVARRMSSSAPTLQNTATVLVPIHDGDGDLVRGLTGDELVAQVVDGPGEIVAFEEIDLGGNGSGVYMFTFVAEETTGSSTVKVLNLESPSQASAEVTIETVTEVNPSRAEEVTILAFTDDPFYADGASQALLLMTVADRSGNAVTGLGNELEMTITEGQGVLFGSGAELEPLAGASGEGDSSVGSGIYPAIYTAGTSGTTTSATIRATFLNADGTIEEQDTRVSLEPLGAPHVVVFPPRIPSSTDAVATVDIFDFDTRGLDQLNLDGLAAANSDVRYRLDLTGGPGRVERSVANDGGEVDLVSDDNVSTALFRLGGATAGEQETSLTVIDLAAAGYPSSEATLELGQSTELRATTSPMVLDQGDAIKVIAFAQDEFGLPATEHDLRITVVSGSAQVLGSGRMIDNGLEVSGYMDPRANDGMYVGALRATGTTGGTITVRITDLTSPNQPEIDLDIEVRE